MSLRDWLRRRARQNWLIYGSLVLLAGVSTWLPSTWSKWVTVAPMFLIVPLVVAYAHSRLACPRCGNALGTVMPPWRLHHGSLRKRVNHCPFCGVSLDAPAK